MILFLTFIAFLSTFLLIKIFLPYFNKYLLDKPNNRSLHKIPIPKSGGIFFALTSSIFLYFMNNPIGIICLPLSFIGALDDKLNISRIIRYLSQLVSVTVIYLLGNGFFQSFQLDNHILQVLLISLIVFFGTAIINFTNFMDGLDGLIAGTMIVWFTAISISWNSSYIILVGSLIGFIIWNWSPAKIFMGDSGSTFLGCIVVGVILNMKSISQLINSLLILSPIFIDSISCILLRLKYKQNIFKPHKKHLYQRLFRAGWSKELVATLYIGNSIVLALAFLKSQYLLYITTFLTIIFGIVLNERKAYNFKNE